MNNTLDEEPGVISWKSWDFRGLVFCLRRFKGVTHWLVSVSSVEDLDSDGKSQQPGDEEPDWPNTFHESRTAVVLLWVWMLKLAIFVLDWLWLWSDSSGLAVKFTSEFLRWSIDDDFEDPGDDKDYRCVDQENVGDSFIWLNAFTNEIVISISLGPVHDQNVEQVESVRNLTQKLDGWCFQNPLEYV